MKKDFIKGAALLAGLAMFFAVSCSSGGSSSGSVEEEESTTETGNIGITVNVDGSISCTFCKKVYQTKAEAGACEHYVCDTCGSVYNSQETVDACTSHVTVRFVDSTNSRETIEYTIKTGNSVQFPVWTVDGSDTIWTADVDGYDEETESFNDNVTFTASWKSFVECTECGEHCDDEEAAAAHALADKTCDECGQVLGSKTEAEACTHYACNNPVDEKTCDKHYLTSEEAAACSHYVCENCLTVCFTQAELDACAVKEGCVKYEVECEACHKKYTKDADAANCAETVNCPAADVVTVTFKDSAEENAFETKTVKVFRNTSALGEKPTWKKDGYKIVWNAEIGVVAEDTEYTATWEVKVPSQWYGLLDFITLKKSDAGTTITSGFKTAETVTAIDSDENEQIFNIAASASNMQVDSHGLKFQKNDTSLSFTTLSATKMTVVFYVSSNNRTLTVTRPNGTTFTVGRGSSGTVVTCTATDATATISSSVVTMVIDNAEAGTWSWKATNDSNTVYTTSVKLEKK